MTTWCSAQRMSRHVYLGLACECMRYSVPIWLRETEMIDCVYRVVDATAFTNDCAAGPWSSSLQHGGAPAALIAWAAERIETREPMHIARLTLDLLRPVPIAPLEIKTAVIREGRKIQLCTVQLLAAGVEVVRASVLKVRAAEFALPAITLEQKVTLPGPEHGHDPGKFVESVNSFADGISLRLVKGALREPGPAAVWFRAHRAIVAGEPISPVMRAALTADFSNGVSSLLSFTDWTFINADLTVSLTRIPVGEWILLDAQTWIGPAGAGTALARLADASGYFGNAIQNLVIEPR